MPGVANYPYNYDDGRANGIYIPKFRNVSERYSKFIRGYGIQGAVQRGMVPANAKAIPGFGAEYKRMIREKGAPAPFWMAAFGEMLPRRENRVSINKDVKDAWGIPVAHIDCTHSDNEREMMRDGLESLKEMATAGGVEITYAISIGGVVPSVANYPYNYDDGRANGIYIPKFRNITERHQKFIRGYWIQGSVQRGMLPTTIKAIPGFGAEYKKMVREAKAPPPFWMAAFGEMLPRRENRVSVNKDVKDAWGIPVAHIDCTHSDNEREMMRDGLESLKEMAAAAGFEIMYANQFLAPPGLAIHEVGTARMGDDPKKSVLNKFNQSWDVKNLFVTDGSCFVSSGCQNPTLTMMALTVRACDYIVDEHKKGNL